MKAFCRVRVGKDFSAIIKKRIKGHKLGKRRPVAKRFKKGQWLEGHFQEFRGNLMFRLNKLYLKPGHFDSVDLGKDDPDMDMDNFTWIMQAVGQPGGKDFHDPHDIFS